MKANHYDILFTGGLDSTYRLCQLALDEKAVIQPIYILFPNDGHFCYRPEMRREIEAQDKILEYIKTQPQTKANILPIKRIYRDEIPHDANFRKYSIALENIWLGWQYAIIGYYAKWNYGVELCIEATLDKFLKLSEPSFYEVDGHKFLDVSTLSSELAFCFQNVSWPIVGTSRDSMISLIKENNYKNVLDYIWFCYKSLDGVPCGICDSCRSKIQQGLLRYFPEESIRRYLVYMVVHTSMPNYVWTLYDKYVYKEDNFAFRFNYSKLVRWFYRFQQIEALPYSVLKKYILEGTSDYNDKPWQNKERIYKNRYDKERRASLEKVLSRIPN